jgi:hypothetical protein
VRLLPKLRQLDVYIAPPMSHVRGAISALLAAQQAGRETHMRLRSMGRPTTTARLHELLREFRTVQLVCPGPQTMEIL